MSLEDHGNGLGTLGLIGPSTFYNTGLIGCEEHTPHIQCSSSVSSTEPMFLEMGMRSEIAMKQLRETSSSMKHVVTC